MKKVALVQTDWRAVALIRLSRNQSKHGRWKVASVARKVGKSERTVYRLLEASLEAGIQVAYR